MLSIDGQIMKYRGINYRQRKDADRVILAYYPRLQDFDIDCYDALEIYHNLVKEAEQ